jgi:hypothetical protein
VSKGKRQRERRERKERKAREPETVVTDDELGTALKAEVEEKGVVIDYEQAPPQAPPSRGYHWIPGGNGEPVLVNGREQFVGYLKDFAPAHVREARRQAEHAEEERLRCVDVQKAWWAKEPPYWKPHHDLEVVR